MTPAWADASRTRATPRRRPRRSSRAAVRGVMAYVSAFVRVRNSRASGGRGMLRGVVEAHGDALAVEYGGDLQVSAERLDVAA